MEMAPQMIILFPLVEEVDVVLLTGREGLVGLGTGYQLDLNLGARAHEDRARQGLADVVVLAHDVQEHLLLASELGALRLDRPHEILVEAGVELRVVFRDPAHHRPAMLIAIATFHELGVDVLEVVGVLLRDAGLLGDDLPGGVEYHLEVLLLGLGLVAQTDLGIAGGDADAATDQDERAHDEGRDEKSFLHDLFLSCRCVRRGSRVYSTDTEYYLKTSILSMNQANSLTFSFKSAILPLSLRKVGWLPHFARFRRASRGGKSEHP